MLSVECWCKSRHGVVAEALVAVHDTGDGVASRGASSNTVLDGESSDGSSDFVVEGMEAT